MRVLFFVGLVFVKGLSGMYGRLESFWLLVLVVILKVCGFGCLGGYVVVFSCVW